MSNPLNKNMTAISQQNMNQDSKCISPSKINLISFSWLVKSSSLTEESPAMRNSPELSSVTWSPPPTISSSKSSPWEKSCSESSSLIINSCLNSSPISYINCYGICGVPLVKAATLLNPDSSTEIVDISKMSHRKPSHYQCIEIADYAGRLKCVDKKISSSCWLEMISITNNCASVNVILMSTKNGIILKVIKEITPGEPLLMWFTERTLTLLEKPCLMTSNIQINNYVCHRCGHTFNYPNPLKIHLKVLCKESRKDHLWPHLAKAIETKSHFFVYNPLALSPVETNHVTEKASSENLPDINSSKLSSSSYSSSSQLTDSPTAAGLPASPATRNLVHQQSPAEASPSEHQTLSRVTNQRPHYFSTSAIVETNAHLARVETLVSDLGKLSKGYQCLICGKIYSRKYGLKIHVRVHTGYKPYMCKYCFRLFTDRSNFNKHAKRHIDDIYNLLSC